MSLAKKIVLHCTRGYEPRVDILIHEFMRDGVRFVGVAGPDCAKVEEMIDEIIVGDGTREPYRMLTASYPGGTVEEVVEVAECLTGEFEGEVRVVIV